MNHYWNRIINDYEKLSSFPDKSEVIELFNKYSERETVEFFENGYSQTAFFIIGTIEATRRMYEENTDDKIRLDLWSIHLQTITMLENVLLINSKKISS